MHGADAHRSNVEGRHIGVPLRKDNQFDESRKSKSEGGMKWGERSVEVRSLGVSRIMSGGFVFILLAMENLQKT